MVYMVTTNNKHSIRQFCSVHHCFNGVGVFLQVKFLKDSTNFGRYMSKSGSSFTPRDDAKTTYIMLVWGMKKQNLGRCHRTDHTCMGDTV